MSQTPPESPAAATALTAPDAPARSKRRVGPGDRRARKNKRPWHRWLREFAVIAAGALAALAAQAWWQNRQDRDRERDYMRRLLADTRENTRRIDQLIIDDSSSEQTVRRVAAFLYDTSAPPPRDTLVAWFLDGGVFSSSAFYPLTNTYTTLLATGDLRLVRNDSLRSELVAYAARMDAEREGMGRYILQVFGDGSRIVRTFPFMRRLFSGDTARMRAEARAFDFAKLRRDPEATQFLFALENAKFNRLHHLRTLRSETAHLGERLEATQQDAGKR
jgi:hypothetical protein